MSTQQTRNDFVADLRRESERWVREGLVSSQQRDSILSLYPGSRAGERDRTITLLTILGSLLLGAGVILFFAANWPKLSAVAKLAVILTVLVIDYAAVYYLTFTRQDYPRLSASLNFLGSLLYGSGIWLVAQIFHLNTHFPNGFLMWGAGLLPLIWATRSNWVLYVATIVLSIWTLSEQTYSLTYNPLFIPVAATLVVLAMRVRSVFAEVLTVFAGFLWIAVNVVSHLGSGFRSQEPALIARFLLLYGLAVFTTGLMKLRNERAYLGLGGLLTLSGLYMMTFRWWEAWNSNIVMASLLSGGLFQVAVALLLALVPVALSAWAWKSESAFRHEAVLMAVLALVVAFGSHLIGQVPRIVLANVLLFVGTVAYILHGIRRKTQLVVNLGLFAFMVHLLTRYFDLFFSAMDRSMFFVLGGVLLLGGGYLLERNRRRWMQDWGGDENAE